ncbi:MAG: tRNA uridine-5-carboxymethylaminomethyl(34) synthesis GTPase MnmE [Pararhodobacter sp.]|nr:tRNA uridine-5-carboxymethylaminomethyl(34) synthesis GTPase MnmE [Pararhodobacter sp.]
MDTIVALATARGRAGVAVVRVSGPRAWDVCAQIAGGVPAPRRASLQRLRDHQGEVLDEALVLVFDAGGSFTGERVVEFQTHGSPAIISALIREILAIEGVRAAEAGEFTRRAFEAGILSLTEVEGLADLLEAETEAQRKLAQRVFDGTAARLLENWREDLLQAVAMLEASIDFSDEEIPDDLLGHILAPLRNVQSAVAREVAGSAASERIREGFEVAIIGAVNAGKSTLLNALAGREAAITSERAGTTRDVIEVRMDIGGLPVTLIDTAGLRETEDEVEMIGISRGQQRAKAADLRVYLKSRPDEDVSELSAQDIVVLSKADLWHLPGISGKTGAGVGDLVSRIEHRLAERVAGSSVFSRERHFDRLRRAESHLLGALAALEVGDTGWEIVSVDIRAAITCLDGIIGRIEVEDVLGRIFSSFCIGK